MGNLLWLEDKCEAKYGRRWNRGVGGTRLTGLCVSYVRICNLQSAKPFLWEQASQRVSNRRVIWSKLFHRVTLVTRWRVTASPKTTQNRQTQNPVNREMCAVSQDRWQG